MAGRRKRKKDRKWRDVGWQTFEPPVEGEAEMYRGDPLARGKRKEYDKMVQYIEAIKQKGVSKQEHDSTMLAETANKRTNTFASVRQSIIEANAKLPKSFKQKRHKLRKNRKRRFKRKTQ